MKNAFRRSKFKFDSQTAKNPQHWMICQTSSQRQLNQFTNKVNIPAPPIFDSKQVDQTVEIDYQLSEISSEAETLSPSLSQKINTTKVQMYILMDRFENITRKYESFFQNKNRQ
ncbi:hypothetical protein SS50377_28036 [Spironucleus salmonicida]|nr:hypothetical protein SS50377_28036 [Spironucleus salmonicida]